MAHSWHIRPRIQPFAVVRPLVRAAVLSRQRPPSAFDHALHAGERGNRIITAAIVAIKMAIISGQRKPTRAIDSRKLETQVQVGPNPAHLSDKRRGT